MTFTVNTPARKICRFCIMDDRDPFIQFDETGRCGYCIFAEKELQKYWHPGPDGHVMWEKKLNEIRQRGQGKEYDCVLGLSGGVDSSYLAYKAKEWGLRPLVVHVDAGWNSELAVHNIERLVKILDLDLHTEVVDWPTMRDLQVAFLKSGIANMDIPQDHAFVALVYKIAAQRRIPYILTGNNYSTESLLPGQWMHTFLDKRLIRYVHGRWGKQSLKKFYLIDYFKARVVYPYIYRIQAVRPFDYLNFKREEVTQLLKEKCGWREYGVKHGESRFTRFFQEYYLIQRFGYDKRKAHLSSLIVSGQMSRENALKKLDEDRYDGNRLREDKEFFIKKLNLSEKEFEELLVAPKKIAHDYPSDTRWIMFLNNVRGFLVKIGLL